MAISTLSARSFLSRGLIPTRLIVQRCFSNNKSRMKKHFFQDSQISIVSRKYSSNSLPQYSAQMINTIVDTTAFDVMQKLFVSLHDLTGLPWWCIIASSALILKITFLPLALYQFKLSERYNLVEQQLIDISKRIRYDISEKQRFYQWDQRKSEIAFMKQFYMERSRLIVENNCSPLRTLLLGYLEVPGWVLISVMWRTTSYGFSGDITASKALLSQMMIEGPIWCSNFTSPDPFYIIPVLVVLSRLCNVQLSVANHHLLQKKSSTLYKIIFNIGRIFAFVLGFSASLIPASVGFFWVCTSVCNSIRIVTLAVPKVRRFLGLNYRSFSHRDLLESFKNDILSILRIKSKKV